MYGIIVKRTGDENQGDERAVRWPSGGARPGLGIAAGDFIFGTIEPVTNHQTKELYGLVHC